MRNGDVTQSHWCPTRENRCRFNPSRGYYDYCLAPPPPPLAPPPHPPSEATQWLLMVYAALDNDLECVALRAVAEQLSGLTDQCYVAPGPVPLFDPPACDNTTCMDTERAGDE